MRKNLQSLFPLGHHFNFAVKGGKSGGGEQCLIIVSCLLCLISSSKTGLRMKNKYSLAVLAPENCSLLYDTVSYENSPLCTLLV